MKAETLQEFLRKLAAPLGAIGVPPPSVAALGSCADALEPFKGLELEHLADLLRRADEARRTGAVPLVEVAAVAPVGTLARKLGEDVLAVESAEGDNASGLERRINQHRHQLQAALGDLALQFGITVKCAETPNWVQLAGAKKVVERLKPHIASPESYQQPAVTDGMRRLTEFGDAVLKQLAVEFGMAPPKGKAEKITGDILAHVTTHRPAGTKPTAAPKPTAGLDDLVRELKEMVGRVEQNPRALTDAEVEGVVTRFKKLKVPEKKEVVVAVTGATARDGTDALLRIKSALIGARQQLDSQNA